MATLRVAWKNYVQAPVLNPPAQQFRIPSRLSGIVCFSCWASDKVRWKPLPNGSVESRCSCSLISGPMVITSRRFVWLLFRCRRHLVICFAYFAVARRVAGIKQARLSNSQCYCSSSQYHPGIQNFQTMVCMSALSPAEPATVLQSFYGVIQARLATEWHRGLSS